MKNVKMAIAIIVVLSSLAFVITALALIVPIKASAFDSDTMADPNSDVIRYLGDSYDITEAIDSLEFFGAEIEQGQGRADTFVFYNDNVITSIIPKEKLMYAGESLVIGDEWGYYIHTQNESPEHGTNNLRSYVTLFDIEDNTEDESETMDVEIRVLLQN